MIYLYYFFALIQTFFAYQSLRSGIDYRQYFQQEINQSKSKYRPFASVIIPCRGLDTDLFKNLVALIELDYPDYELLFVVDDKKDLAVPIIEEVVQNSQRDTKLIVAGKAKTSGQKVHNLRQAVIEISDKSEVLVFVDSDARPKKSWLQNLIAPLKDEKIGCATGYRWFIQKKNGFATHLRAVWNASIASALGESTDGNFCWGGSTAIRRTTFEKLDVRKKWEGTLSDDFALTNALREANLPIHFVPQCLTATVEDTTLWELIEFSTRQMKITRVYSPLHFKVSVIGSVLFTSVFWTGVILLLFLSGIHFWITFAFITIIFLLGAGKAWIRLESVKLVLKGYESELNRQFIPQILLWMISPILFLYNNVLAIFSRKIVWRGIEYKLESAQKTVIGRKDGQ